MVRNRLLSFVAVLAVAGCSPADSPEQQVRTVIGQMEVAAEARDVGELMEHLSEEYRDSNGMGPQDAARYVRGYFMANPTIHLLTRIEDIEFPIEDEARARVLVGMVGRDSAAASPGANWRDLTADVYEFKVVLRREDDEWKVSFAQWLRK
jgi:hypothetical protein